jgi:hypothetical protein
MAGASFQALMASVAASGGGTTASNFLARTSGLDGTHSAAYTALLNGLDTDGLTSKLDVLHVYATQDSTTALLNLMSSSYNGTSHGSPTFTADRGFTGTGSSTTIYIDTNFIPSSAVSPKFVLNSGHISIWDASDTGQSPQGMMGAFNSSGTVELISKFTDNNSYFLVNGNSYTTVASSTAQGHYVANRSGASATQGYKNGSNVVSGTTTSTGLPGVTVTTLAMNSNGTIGGSNVQMAMASIGSSLSSTDATNFYNRLRTFMTAVGVP